MQHVFGCYTMRLMLETTQAEKQLQCEKGRKDQQKALTAPDKMPSEKSQNYRNPYCADLSTRVQPLVPDSIDDKHRLAFWVQLTLLGVR